MYIQQSIPPPPPLEKFNSPNDNVMLEDESGRIKLVGDRVKNAQLVTGVIIGALGVETQRGEFEVVDIVYAGMAPQTPVYGAGKEEKMDVDGALCSNCLCWSRKCSLSGVPVNSPPTHLSPSDEWVAAISGLDVGSPSSPDAQIQLLVEYLTGEGSGSETQPSPSQISRLIIAGNSLPPVITSSPEIDKKPVRVYRHPRD